MTAKKTLQDKILEGRQYRRCIEVRVKENPTEDPKEMIVEGHACTFNSPYTLYRDADFEINEQIDPHAFDECDMSDVIMQYDHQGRIFARTKNGTLTVEPDEIGLAMRSDLSKSEGGPGLYRDIQSGMIDKMSFGFTVNEDKWEETEDKTTGKYTGLRTITKIGKLYDVSAVSIPANDGTDISARNYIDGVIDAIKTERSKVQKREHKRNVLKLKLETLGIKQQEESKNV